jgi:mxaL protein
MRSPARMSLAWLSKHFGRDSITLLGAFTLLLVALFMPRWKLPHDTYDYIVVFDITQSMDVEDYELDGAPVSRLTYARNAVRQALGTLPCGARVGWGAFAEYRSLLLLSPVEVCENYNDLLGSLDNIDGRMRWANASEVGKGVYWAVRMALNADPRPDVIFISDGHEAPPLHPAAPLAMPDDVQPGQIRGWIVGAGGETPQPVPRTDEEDRRAGYWNAHDVIQLVSEDGKRIVSTEHLSALREPHLKALADRVGFGYTRLTTPEALASAMLDPRFVRREDAPVDLYWMPVVAAVLLLLARFLPDSWGVSALAPRLRRR